ncbi:cyclin-I [Takifugu flavidus]|uniref:Cyclin-I n=1 Tax=Takifugu flavidus TaxID=433684 RepID=A0A5C6NHD6_9TELE|nr:cyclin-I [Takifugu flavidus]TWW66894.1 Cyclin-I [Takifugu flavidus]
MKILEPWGHQKLSFLLEKAASREAEIWRVYVPKKPSSQDTDISPAQRDEAVRWLMELHRRLQLYPETLVLAVSIMDRFLAPIKARPKYLRCIAITCFFLASKTSEEDERVPSLKELAASSSCGCSPSEILRMERIILDKLNWDLHSATALDFLHIFHAMVSSCRSGLLDTVLGLTRSQHLSLLTLQLYHCLADHTLMQLKGSMLALALLSLELETCCPDWLGLTFDLLKKTQINSSELIWSRELVARSLSARRAALSPNSVYVYQPLQQSPKLPFQPPDLSLEHQLLASSTVQLQTPTAGKEGAQSSVSSCTETTPALLSPLKHLSHRNPLQKVTVRCKSSTKRKVEEMEEDDFYDDIKRLYNEDTTTAVHEGVIVSGEGGLGVCSVPLSTQEGSSSPCPPLQPAGAS